MSEIASTDCRVLGKFPNAPANSWSEVLSEEDREAYRRIHRTLMSMADSTASRFDGQLQSVPRPGGFNEKSGVRNQRPKDLWAALINPDSHDYVGMPQIFAIASERGVEMGFAAAIHTSQFSDARVKRSLRNAIPTLFRLFPRPDSQIVLDIGARLREQRRWNFRDRTRLAPGQQEFASLPALIQDLSTPKGLKRGAAAVSRYFGLEELDDPGLSLQAELTNIAETFLPLMASLRSRYAYGSDLVAMNRSLKASEEESSAETLGSFDPQSPTDGRRRILASITQRQGQGPFRLSLLEAYEGKCAVTGAGTPQTLDAAHIFPYDGNQTNHVSNGILLRSDIHVLFDLGLLKIDDEYRVIVSNKIDEDEYRRLHGSSITLPSDSAARPSKKALAWHRQNVVFGES